MNFAELTDLITGILQFIVAGYALRLNRLFGARRVGWSLFSAFALLALLNLMQSTLPAGGMASGIKAEALYALISLLLLTGMIHLASVLKERDRVERAELRMRTELQMELQIKTAYLFRTIEELQAEIDQRKRAEAEVETMRRESVEALKR
jgi:C4-dicarboxylate-specific signal transduction histidine kinase